MRENPKYLPFLRDLARQPWPDYDATRLILADRLGDGGDRREGEVRAAVPDVWGGSSWHNAALIGPGEAGLFKGACVSPRSRHQSLQHFAPLWRVVVDRERSGMFRARLVVAMFGLWKPFEPHEPDACWRQVALLVERTDRSFAVSTAHEFARRFPEEDYEVVLPTV